MKGVRGIKGTDPNPMIHVYLRGGKALCGKKFAQYIPCEDLSEWEPLENKCTQCFEALENKALDSSGENRG